MMITFATLEAQAFYNPSTGRWFSRDPVEEQGGINLYSFVNNKSPNLVDPYGETGWAIVDPIPRCKPCRISKSFDYTDKPFKDAARSITSQPSYYLNDYVDALEAALNGAPAPPGGPADKWRHCTFVCITFREVGPIVALAAAVISELPGVRGGVNDPYDAEANALGLLAAHFAGTCSKHCACLTQDLPY